MATITEGLTEQDYTKAMNTLGQSLLVTLDQAIKSLPTNLRTSEVISQSIAAFLANVVYQQAPNDKSQRQAIHKHLQVLVSNHLDNFGNN